MKSKIPLLLICAIYISSVNGMDFVPKEVKEYYTQKTILDAMIKALKMARVLRPTNRDVINSRNFACKQFNSSTTNPVCPELIKYLIDLINSNDDDVEKIKYINTVMICLSFDFEAGMDEELAPETLHEVYLNNFIDLLDTICKTEPQKLILRSAWQVLSVMPSLFDTLCAMGCIGDKNSNKFDINEFEKSASKTNNQFTPIKGIVYLNKYLSLMAKVVQTDFAQQDILLTRLVQKLGTNLEFIDYVNKRIEKISVFKNTLKKRFLNLLNKEDATEKQINLIRDEIAKLKKEAETLGANDTSNKIIEPLNIPYFGEESSEEEDEEDNNNKNTKQEETEE